MCIFLACWCTFVFFFLRRQNRRDRLLRKRWSHIALDLFVLLENNELNVISLKASQLESGSEFHFTNISAVTLVLQSEINESTKCKLQVNKIFIHLIPFFVHFWWNILDSVLLQNTQRKPKQFERVYSVKMSQLRQFSSADRRWKKELQFQDSTCNLRQEGSRTRHPTLVSPSGCAHHVVTDAADATFCRSWSWRSWSTRMETSTRCRR